MFLEKYKKLVGFHAWKILVKEDFCTGDNHATCDSNIYEQTLTIELNESFLELPETRQESVLIHELVHGRIEVFNKIVEELKEFEEERLANDLERGFYSIIEKISNNS